MASTGATYDATFRISCDLEKSPLERCRQKYTTIRRNTHELLEEEIFRAFRKKIEVTHIDADVLSAIDEQWCLSDRLMPFAWGAQIMRTLAQTHPRAMEMALWHEKQLCGLAVARLSDAKTWLSITHIEGCPTKDHPLKSKVVPIVIAGSQIYASQVQLHDALGRLPTLRIMRPLEGAEDWYKKLGYSRIEEGRGNGERYKFIVATTRRAP